MSSGPALARRLGTGDAVVVGLVAMIGAGVFSVFGPAASAAGSGLLVSLAVAAVVATCNATSSAQLATAHPTSGGTYVWGRAVLGEWWGFAAGWAFVVGKTASCAAMALTFATYAVPGHPVVARALAAGAVVALTTANLRGVQRTAVVARVLLATTVTALVVAGVVAWLGPAVGFTAALPPASTLGVLQGAGLLFFAFAGYARIATLAEEVREPEVLTRAVLMALGVVLVLYAVAGLTLVRTLGPDLAGSTAPWVDAVHAAGAGWAGPMVRVGATAGALGALLALLAGVARTSLAMARERDLPPWLASVDEVHRVPDHAQVVLGLLVVALVLVADLRLAIGFSSCGVLLYYAVANLSALRQPAEERRWPRLVPLTGLVGCLLLVATLPRSATVGGVLVVLVGLAGRLLVRRLGSRRA